MQGGASLCKFIRFGALAGLSLSLLLSPTVHDNPIDIFPIWLLVMAGSQGQQGFKGLPAN
jgi:hypothetical protein